MAARHVTEPTLLLCDHAQEVAGKLYVLGGGWSIYRGAPVTMGLAVKIAVPWEAANVPHDFPARLVTEDGLDPVLPTAEGEPRRDPGRVPGPVRGRATRPGWRRAATSTRRSRSTSPASRSPPGRYEWQVEIDQNVVGRVAFTVMES